MNKKIGTKRLQLSKETLRSLSSDELAGVAGGSFAHRIGGGVIIVESDDGINPCNVGSAVVATFGTASITGTGLGCSGGILNRAGNPAINGGG